jgi:hypothetical protein
MIEPRHNRIQDGPAAFLRGGSTTGNPDFRSPESAKPFSREIPLLDKRRFDDTISSIIHLILSSEIRAGSKIRPFSGEGD